MSNDRSNKGNANQIEKKQLSFRLDRKETVKTKDSHLLAAINQYRIAKNSSLEEYAAAVQIRTLIDNGVKPPKGYEIFAEFGTDATKNRVDQPSSENKPHLYRILDKGVEYTPYQLRELKKKAKIFIESAANNDVILFKNDQFVYAGTQGIVTSIHNTLSAETTGNNRGEATNTVGALQKITPQLNDENSIRFLEQLMNKHPRLKAAIGFNNKDEVIALNYPVIRMSGEYLRSLKSADNKKENGVARFLRHVDEFQAVKDELAAVIKSNQTNLDATKNPALANKLALLDNKLLNILKEEIEAIKLNNPNAIISDQKISPAEVLKQIEAKIVVNQKVITEYNSNQPEGLGKQLLKLLTTGSVDGKDVSYQDEHIGGNNSIFNQARKLIEAGADLSATDKSGRTALHKAAHHGYSDVADLLISKGANINANDKQGRTPLDDAKRGFDVGYYLAKTFSDPDIRSQKNKTVDHSDNHNQIKDLIEQKLQQKAAQSFVTEAMQKASRQNIPKTPAQLLVAAKNNHLQKKPAERHTERHTQQTPEKKWKFGESYYEGIFKGYNNEWHLSISQGNKKIKEGETILRLKGENIKSLLDLGNKLSEIGIVAELSSNTKKPSLKVSTQSIITNTNTSTEMRSKMRDILETPKSGRSSIIN
jgi:hypothetical protein